MFNAAPNKQIGAVAKTKENEKTETKTIKTGNENKSKTKVAKAKKYYHDTSDNRGVRTRDLLVTTCGCIPG